MRPRFSVLLPTRGGAALLPECVEAILADEAADLELIVSDNANTDPTREALEAFRSDARLTVIQQRSVLSVTENWNAALAASRGEYILMLGDDDIVLPGFFAVAARLLAEHGKPDCLSYEAWMFAAPYTIPAVDSGLYGAPWTDTYPPAQNGVISAGARRQVVRDLYRFRQPIALTTATVLISRTMVDRLQGRLFVPPFPDWYAYAALLLRAKTWVHSPGRYVVVGVSAKSFGQYFNGANYDAGFSYLGWEKPVTDDAPTDMLDAVVAWLERVKLDFAPDVQEIEIDYPGFIVRRVWGWIKLLSRRQLGAKAFVKLLLGMSSSDWTALVAAMRRTENIRRAASVARSCRSYAAHPWWKTFRPVPARTIGGFAQFLVETDQLDRDLQATDWASAGKRSTERIN